MTFLFGFNRIIGNIKLKKFFYRRDDKNSIIILLKKGILLICDEFCIIIEKNQRKFLGRVAVWV